MYGGCIIVFYRILECDTINNRESGLGCRLFKMSSTLSQLEHLSLVSKVTTELDNHLGMNDKVLAEFLIHLHSEAKDLEAFAAAVKGAAGGDFPKTLIESLDRLMRVLKSDSSAGSNQNALNQKQTDKKGFPGLSIPDDPDRINKLDQLKDTVDDKSFHNRYEMKDDRSSRSSHKHDRRRNLSPKIVEIDDKVVVGKVYSGRVTNIKDFGAFVALNGIRQRSEGLVHISNIQDSRISHPADVVQRGDNVFVKVLEINGDRIRLSMKDADQKTGIDLTANDLQGGVLSTDMGSSLINSLMAKKTGRKRMTSPERFEIKQLIAAGVVNPRDYPELMNQDQDETGPTGMIGLELEEEIDIELKEEEPLFLKVCGSYQ